MKASSQRLLDHVVGHQSTIERLLASVDSDHFPSTVIFAGPEGIGKKMVALGIAQAMLCERRVYGGCGVCGPCIRIANGQSEGLLLIEAQGAAIKVEQAREALHFLALQKLGRARAVIINNAHLLNPQAGNSLLKELEEPTPNATFFLITGQASSLLSTIRSRAQTVRFQPLSDIQLCTALDQRGEVIAPETRTDILREARGSVAEALRLSAEAEALGAVRSAMAAFLAAPADRFPNGALAKLRDACEDRSGALFAARTAQEVARDLSRSFGSTRVGHAHATLSESAAAVAVAHRNLSLDGALVLGQLALDAEQDLARNVDRSLVFENFWFDWSRACRRP